MLFGSKVFFKNLNNIHIHFKRYNTWKWVQVRLTESKNKGNPVFLTCSEIALDQLLFW